MGLGLGVVTPLPKLKPQFFLKNDKKKEEEKKRTPWRGGGRRGANPNPKLVTSLGRGW